jgi:hypothetical protein
MMSWRRIDNNVDCALETLARIVGMRASALKRPVAPQRATRRQIRVMCFGG